MSCNDIPSLLDLQKVKKHAEDFGRLMGTGEGDSTNEVTGQVRPTFNKVINDMRGDFNQQLSDQESEFNQHVSGMAFARVGTFKSGATLDDLREVLLWDVANGGDGHEYGWTGAFQKEVLPNSTPSSTGGIGPGAWVDRTDVTLRSELSAPGGAGLVGGLAKPVTWSGFAGGADSTGVASSDAAFAAAEGDVHIPEGNYNIASQPTIAANFDASGYAVLSPLINYCPSGAHPDKGDVRVRKYWGRQFFGAASNGNGQYDGTTTSGKGPGWAERDAQFAVASADGLIAIFGNSKSSDTPSYHASPSCMGVGGGIINDKAGAFGWSLYGDVRREAGAGGTFGLELAVKNRGDNVTRRAYTKSYGACGIWLAGGGDPSYQGAPLYPSNFAIAIGKNGHTWNRGIVFDSDGITGTDGLTGTGIAMEFAKGHTLLWSTPSNQNGLTFRSDIDDTTRGVNAVFANGQLTLLTGANKPFLRSSYATGSVNFVEIAGSVSGQGVRVLASGDDTDVSLRLEAKGAGEVIAKGNLAPLNGNTYSCGTALKPWSGGFTQAAFTVTSDERAKTKPEQFTDAMLDAAAEVEWVLFQYLDRVEDKGEDGARWHFGAIAQRFVEAFKKHGLDPFRFAFICYDEWEDQYVKVQTNEGETVTKTRAVSQPVMVATTREVMVDDVLEDGTKIKKATMEEYQTPKLIQVYIFNEDGSPRLDNNGVRCFVMEPVMEDIIEEYTEPAPPEYVDVLETSAGSRYCIRYDQAIILKQKQIERDHKRQIDALVARIEALEGN